MRAHAVRKLFARPHSKPLRALFFFSEQWRDGLFDCFGVAGPSSFCMSFCFPACTPCIFAKISSRIRSERILGRCALSLPDRAPHSDHNLIIMNQSFIVTKLVLNTGASIPINRIVWKERVAVTKNALHPAIPRVRSGGMCHHK